MQIMEWNFYNRFVVVYLTRFGHKLSIKLSVWMELMPEFQQRTITIFKHRIISSPLYQDDAYIHILLIAMTIIYIKLLSCMWNKAERVESFNIFHFDKPCKRCSLRPVKQAQKRAHRNGERRRRRQNWKPQTKQNARNLFCHIFHHRPDCCYCLWALIRINLIWANHFTVF